MHATSFDAIVAGGGIIGTAAAGMLARAGLRVLLLDAREEGSAGPRWINGVPGRAFDDAGVPRPTGEELHAAGHTFTLVSPSSTTRVFLDDHGVLEVDMRHLGARLRDEARKAGATLRFEARVSRVDVEAGRIRSLEARGTTFRAALFVDATGLPAVLRRARFPSWPSVRRADLCSASQVVFDIADRAGAERWLSRERATSGKVVARVGVAGGFSVVNVRVDLDAGLVSILTGSVQDVSGRPSGTRLLEALVAENPWIGRRRFGGSGAIPLRRPYARLGAPGLALVGDAGCLAFAGHGSGIGTGLVSARLLADVVSASSDPGAPRTTWRYAAKVHHTQGGLLLAYDLLRRASQALTSEETDSLLAAGLASRASLQAAFEQVPPPLGARALLRTFQSSLGAPLLSLRLARQLRHLPTILAHGAHYPNEIDWPALHRYEARSARLVGDPLDPLE